ncbi:MAG: hypothetical protein LBT96_03070 [Campylobacteraceae bacterium]|jgi:hypothetical protein|nr:hypothetical protein [Campylobacteraceae bacterium]
MYRKKVFSVLAAFFALFVLTACGGGGGDKGGGEGGSVPTIQSAFPPINAAPTSASGYVSYTGVSEDELNRFIQGLIDRGFLQSGGGFIAIYQGCSVFVDINLTNGNNTVIIAIDNGSGDVNESAFEDAVGSVGGKANGRRITRTYVHNSVSITNYKTTLTNAGFKDDDNDEVYEKEDDDFVYLCYIDEDTGGIAWEIKEKEKTGGNNGGSGGNGGNGGNGGANGNVPSIDRSFPSFNWNANVTDSERYIYYFDVSEAVRGGLRSRFAVGFSSLCNGCDYTKSYAFGGQTYEATASVYDNGMVVLRLKNNDGDIDESMPERIFGSVNADVGETYIDRRYRGQDLTNEFKAYVLQLKNNDFKEGEYNANFLIKQKQNDAFNRNWVYDDDWRAVWIMRVY